MKKTAVITIVIILFAFSSLSCSRYSLRGEGSSELFGPLENMHVIEELRYPQSPFNGLIQDAFKNNKHYVNVLNTGDEALLARVHLIRMARRSINIQTFIWGDDTTAEFLANELLKAAKRGVKVNIIIDAVPHSDVAANKSILASANENVKVKYYNPVARRVRYSKIQLLGSLITQFSKLNQRMHNKLFIIDDRIAITGGRNYYDDYFDRGKHKNFQDRGCLVIGPLVKEMTDSFMDYWSFKWSIPNYEMADIKLVEASGAEDDFRPEKMLVELDRQASNYREIKNLFVQKAYPVESIEFISDGPGKTKHSRFFKSSSVADDLSEFIADTCSSLIIQTPYLVLPKKAEKAFLQLRRKNPDVDIRVSTNSLSTTDNFMAYALSYQNKKKYLKKLKWRIFEFKYRPQDADLIVRPINTAEREKKYMVCIHAKTYVVDREKVFIGSFNVDPRSEALNTESGCLIYDKKLAGDVAEDILRAMAPQNSWTIARCTKVPGFAQVSGVMEDAAKKMPVIDVWPYTYATSFELIEGKDELPFYHKDFYKHYKAVGLFPDVAGTQKSIKTRLFRALLGKTTEPFL